MNLMMKCILLVVIVVLGYKNRYKIMNALLALEEIRRFIISQATKFPSESAYIYQR